MKNMQTYDWVMTSTEIRIIASVNSETSNYKRHELFEKFFDMMGILKFKGLLEKSTRDYQLTEKGENYLKALCCVPFSFDEALEPCPFCNKDAKIQESIGTVISHELYRVYCTSCGCSSGKHMIKQLAYEAWNTRHV